MKKFALITVGLVAAIVGVLATTAPAQALDFRRGDSIKVDKQETLQGSAYLAGTTLQVDGRIQGDLYCAGQDITINGVVEGDVLCAGQYVKVLGTVEGDVRIAGQVAEVMGTVNGSVNIFGQVASISKDATVGRDATVMSSTATINGKIGRDLLAAAETITYAAATARDAELSAKTIRLQNGSRVEGNLVFVTQNESLPNQAQVVGGTTTHKLPEQESAKQSNDAQNFLVGPLYWLAAFLMLGAALLLAAPRSMQRVEQAAKDKPWASLGYGLLAFLVTPLLAAFAIVTLAGFPLGVAIASLWVVAVLVSPVLATYIIGRMIVRKMEWNIRGQRFVALLVGTLLLMVLSIIPILGGLVLLASLIWGMGLLTTSVFTARQAKPAKTTK